MPRFIMDISRCKIMFPNFLISVHIYYISGILCTSDHVPKRDLSCRIGLVWPQRPYYNTWISRPLNNCCRQCRYADGLLHHRLTSFATDRSILSEIGSTLLFCLNVRIYLYFIFLLWYLNELILLINFSNVTHSNL
jgi:hypothetical protein